MVTGAEGQWLKGAEGQWAERAKGLKGPENQIRSTGLNGNGQRASKHCCTTGAPLKKDFDR